MNFLIKKKKPSSRFDVSSNKKPLPYPYSGNKASWTAKVNRRPLFSQCSQIFYFFKFVGRVEVTSPGAKWSVNVPGSGLLPCGERDPCLSHRFALWMFKPSHWAQQKVMGEALTEHRSPGVSGVNPTVRDGQLMRAKGGRHDFCIPQEPMWNSPWQAEAGKDRISSRCRIWIWDGVCFCVST